MSATFRPSRQYRRRFAGQPCPACGNRVDPADLVAFAPGGQTFYLHESCVEVALEAAAGSTASEEETKQEPTAATSEVTMSTEEA